MIIGTVENSFFFWRQCCTSALFSVSTTAPKRMLFRNANFWWFQALFNLFFCFFGSSIVKSCSTMPTFDAFRHCWAFLYSGGNVVLRRFWWLVLQCGNKGTSWSLLALLKMVFFCGGSVVLRHCWELVHQCRKECFSTMPTFDNFSALQIILLFSGGNVVLRRCWWLVHQCRKNAIQQCQLLMIFGHCLIFFLFSGVKVVLGAVDGWYYSAETKVFH